MSKKVKVTIFLSPEAAREAEAYAHAEGTTLSAVVVEALRAKKATRLHTVLTTIQHHWSHIAQSKGILTEQDLDRILCD